MSIAPRPTSGFRGLLATLLTKWAPAVVMLCLIGGAPETTSGQPPVAQDAVEEKPAAKEPEQKKDEKPKVAPNPLANLIRNIFRPGANPPAQILPNNPAAGNGKQPAGAQPIGRDHIDARVPNDPRQSNLLSRARTHIDEQNWPEALTVLQFLLDRPYVRGEKIERGQPNDDVLVRNSDGRFTPVRQEALRLLNRMPDDVRESYRLEHGALARQILEDGRTEGDLSKVVEVATRYFHTTAGHDAADFLGSMHFDRGEFAMAARWFATLQQAGAERTTDTRWLLKAALAYERSGSEKAGRAALNTIAEQPARPMAGGAVIEPKSWLKTWGKAAGSSTPILTNWLMPYGTSQRLGKAVGGTPLLLPRWTQPLTMSHPVAEQIDTLLEDLVDQQRSPILTFVPLMVDGKAIYRTLRGVQVVDATTGTPLWETREGISAERVLNGSPPPQFDGQDVNWQNRGNLVAGYYGNGADYHPLASLLFRNGNHGLISSDGERLFVIEGQAILSRQQPGSGVGFRPEQNDPYGRSWTTNRLVAYSVKTGHPLWEVGGVQRNEPFDLKLAGTSFHGAPVASGGELYIVGERDSEVRLFALEPRTGGVLWSQLLAFADTDIDQDLGRRWRTAQVSVSDGIIVCPTTVGWLTAVDRTTHSILWVHRFSVPDNGKNNRNGRQQNMVQRAAINSVWCPSAPVITGNRVLYTPAEDASLQCLNLQTGDTLWRKPKATSLYLAGVFDDRAVLVGTTSVTAVSVDSGTTLWTTPIASESGHPSGYGVAVGDRYLLPLTSGQLWSLKLADGKVIEKLRPHESAAPLGNLAMHQGLLFSLSPLGMTSYEQQEAFQAELQRRKTADPDDAWALLREADTLLLQQETADALEVLRRIDPADLTNEDRSRYRRAMLSSLSEVIRNDFSAHDREMQELQEFVTTPAERLAWQRLRAQQLVVRDEYEAAFDLYREIAGDSGELMMRRGDQSAVELPVRRWVKGQLADLWASAPPEVRQRLDDRVHALAAKALEENDDVSAEQAAMEGFVRDFGFHPAAQAVWRDLVSARSFDVGIVDARMSNHLVAAHAMQEAVAGPDPADAAIAMIDYALSLESTHPRDAAYYARLAIRRYGDVMVDDQLSVVDHAGIMLGKDLLSDERTLPEITWGNRDLTLTRSGSNYSSHVNTEMDSGPHELPFFAAHRFEIDQQYQRLAVIDAENDDVYWMVPLRSRARHYQGNHVAAMVSGHQVILLHRDVLHCLSPLDKVVQWTRPLPVRGRSPGYYRTPSRTSPRKLVSLSSAVANFSLAHQTASSGMLAIANSRYVCVYGRREFIVIDATSGETLWTFDKLPANSRLYGTRDFVVMVPQDYSQTVVFRALDGRPIELDNAAELITRTIHVDGDELVTIETRTAAPTAAATLGLTNRERIARIRKFHPLSGEESWRVEYPAEALFSMLGDSHAAILQPSGNLDMLNLKTGQKQPLRGLTADDVKATAGIVALADHRRVYLAVQNRRRSSNYYYSESVPSLKVNGQFWAFDQQTGEKLWQHEVDNQNLVLQHLEHSPILTFAARTYIRKDNLNYWSLRLLALDKQTGRELVNSKAPSNSGFRAMRLNMRDGYVELQSYSERIRMSVVGGSATAPAESAEPAGDETTSDDPSTPETGAAEKSSAPADEKSVKDQKPAATPPKAE